MDRVVAQHILNGLSSQVAQVAIEEYVKSRIDNLYLLLETSRNPLHISEAQGAIGELRSLLKARTSAAAVLELERNGK